MRLNSCDSPVFFGHCLSGCIHDEGKKAPVRWLLIREKFPCL